MFIPAYYINRASRPDRRSFMERQFSALGLEATRIEAIEVADLSAETIDRYANPRRVTFRRASSVACESSHIKAWRAGLATSADWFLVFEDDALISARLPEVLARFDGQNFDIVRLEAVSRRKRLLPPIGEIAPGFAIRKYRSMLFGAAGYLVSRRAVEIMLAREDRLLSIPVDIALSYPLDWPGRVLSAVLVDPGLCVQLNVLGESGLAHSDNKLRTHPNLASRKVKLQRRIRNVVSDLRNAADHLWHVPAGISWRRSPYEGTNVLPEEDWWARTDSNRGPAD